MLALTSPVRTRYHAIAAGPKLLALLVITSAVMWMDRPLPLAAMLGAAALAHLAEGRAFARFGWRNLRPMWPLGLVLMVWHLWLGMPEAGAVMILRLATAIACANMVTATTRLDDMIAVVQRICTPLEWIGLSPKVVGMAFALMIRFVPLMGLRVGQIADAARARGGKSWRVVQPAALAALDEAEHVADALRARGGL